MGTILDGGLETRTVQQDIADALALIERTSAMLRSWVPTTDLEIAAASYERQVSELVDADEETATYVASLEERHDDAFVLACARGGYSQGPALAKLLAELMLRREASLHVGLFDPARFRA